MTAKKAAKAAPKPAPAKKPEPKITATPAPILSTEDSASKDAVTNEPSGAPAAAAQRQPSVILYVKPNGRTRRASVISTDGDYAHIRLEDGTQMRNVVRSKSADQCDCWKPA